MSFLILDSLTMLATTSKIKAHQTSLPKLMVMKFTILEEVSFTWYTNLFQNVQLYFICMYEVLHFIESISLKKCRYIAYMKCRNQHLVTACAIFLK